MSARPRGPLFVDVDGPELTPEDREILLHPAVGGVVLFTRNYEDGDQLAALTKAIKRLGGRDLVVAVDHEGGRVQRFRDGPFAHLPPAALYGRVGDDDPESARTLAVRAGWLLASDLAAASIDVSFAPVIDCHHEGSDVLGDRTFHTDPARVATLARAFLTGMRAGGIAGCVKHFPGHGGVAGDSHTELPEDPRTYEALERRDLVAFSALADAEALMTAHVRYPAIDPDIPAFSRFWLVEVKQRRIRSDAVVVSDDLSMAGAALIERRPEDRVARALASGCDIVLLLNDRRAVVSVLDAGRAVRPVPDALWRRWSGPAVAARRAGGPPELAGVGRDTIIAALARSAEKFSAAG